MMEMDSIPQREVLMVHHNASGMTLMKDETQLIKGQIFQPNLMPLVEYAILWI